MSDAFADLIARMAVREPANTGSADSIAWHAYREAEALDDPAVIAAAETYLAGETSQDQRRAVYTVLGYVGPRLAPGPGLALLMRRLPGERDRYALARLLETIGEFPKPDDFDTGPIVAHLSDPRSPVRQAAIQALSRSDAPGVELLLRAQWETTRNRYDRRYIERVLAGIEERRNSR